MNSQYIQCLGLCNMCVCVCCYSLPHRSGAGELLGIRSWSFSTEVTPQVPQDPLILSHMTMFRIYLYQFVYPTYIDSSYIYIYRFSVSPNNLLPGKILVACLFSNLRQPAPLSTGKAAISYKPRLSPESRKAVLQRKVPMQRVTGRWIKAT